MSLIRRTMSLSVPFATAIVLAGTLAVGGCSRHAESVPEPAIAATPVEAVKQLLTDLRGNDLVGYADHALPPALHHDVAMAWAEGRTAWPLSELPLSEQLPGFIVTLAAPDAEKTLLASFRRQFSGADRELRSAASTLGLFAAQYVQQSEDYSDVEREHYVQLIAALSAWGAKAPLSDPTRAKVAVPQLVAAARLTGLGKPDALRTIGMERSLTRLGPFLARFKAVLSDYDLDFDASLSGAQVRLIEQTGDTALVAVTYTLADQPVDARIRLERLDGHWYPSDLIRHAQSQVTAEAHPSEPVAADEDTAKPRPY